MVNISTDAKTVTVSDDFTRLQAQYATVNFTNSPAKTNAGNTAYPSCPANTGSFLASTTLPPTPNSKLCDCVTQTFSCLFTPQTNNYTAIVGALLDFGCSQLGTAGGNCNIIGSNGQNGTYGSLSGCDPSAFLFIPVVCFIALIFHVATKLSYVMSSIYEASNRNTLAVCCSLIALSSMVTSLPSVTSMGTQRSIHQRRHHGQQQKLPPSNA